MVNLSSIYESRGKPKNTSIPGFFNVPSCSWEKWRLFPPTWDDYFHTLTLYITTFFTLSPIVMKDLHPMAFWYLWLYILSCVPVQTHKTLNGMFMFKSFTCQKNKLPKKKHQKTFGIWSGPVGVFFVISIFLQMFDPRCIEPPSETSYGPNPTGIPQTQNRRRRLI